MATWPSTTTLPAELGKRHIFACLWMHLGQRAFSMRRSTSSASIIIFNCSIRFVSKTLSVMALSSAESELYVIGTSSGEAHRLRPCLSETKLWGKPNVDMEADSSSGNEIATMFGASGKTRHIQLRCLYMKARFQRRSMKLRRAAGKQNPPDTMANRVKTEMLLRHMHRFNMVMTRDGLFKVVSIYIERVQAVSSTRAEHLRVYPSASCDITTIMLSCPCFATLASELPDDRLRQSDTENTMTASSMEAPMTKRALKEKAKELLGMYRGLTAEEKPLLLYQAINNMQMASTSPDIISRTSSTSSSSSRTTHHSRRASVSTTAKCPCPGITRFTAVGAWFELW